MGNNSPDNHRDLNKTIYCSGDFKDCSLNCTLFIANRLNDSNLSPFFRPANLLNTFNNASVLPNKFNRYSLMQHYVHKKTVTSVPSQRFIINGSFPINNRASWYIKLLLLAGLVDGIGCKVYNKSRPKQHNIQD